MASEVNRNAIFELFLFDTYVSSSVGCALSEYMMKKHGWTRQDFISNDLIYRSILVDRFVEEAPHGELACSRSLEDE